VIPTAADILSSCPLFRAVREPAWSKLKGMALLKSYEQGEMIFRQGEPCPGVFVVGSGLVRIFKTAPSGKEHVLHMIAPGNTFAEIAAIGGFDCPAFAEALEPTTCALLPTDPFDRLLNENHQLCLQLLTGMAGWVKHMVDLVEDITLRDAIGRVARHLTTLADQRTGVVRLPSFKRHLASHLHLTSETLSRTLRRLSEMSLIESDGEEVVVKDPRGLADLAEGT